MRRDQIKQNHVLANNTELETFNGTLKEIEDILKTFDSSHTYIQDCTGRELRKVLLTLKTIKDEINRHIENITTLHTTLENPKSL